MNNTITRYYYTYVLQSEKDNDFYVGFTDNIRKRINEHNKGKVPSTKNRLPMKLLYYESCLDQDDAIRREKYLKSAWGKRYLRNRLRNYLTG